MFEAAVAHVGTHLVSQNGGLEISTVELFIPIERPCLLADRVPPPYSVRSVAFDVQPDDRRMPRGGDASDTSRKGVIQKVEGRKSW